MRIMTFGLCMLVINSSMMNAEDVLPKRTLKANSTEVYNILPPEVESLSDMFSKGEFYGRLRLNTFLFKWDEEIDDKRKDHYTIGVGGSFIYKSAYLHGFGFTAGLYTTQNPWHMPDEDVKYYKTGRGVLNRYNVGTKGQYGLTALAQAYVEYKNEQTSVRVGDQIL